MSSNVFERNDLNTPNFKFVPFNLANENLFYDFYPNKNNIMYVLGYI